MRTVLYPGSFDPVTVGHMDIITRAAARFERVYVAIVHNPEKQTSAFSAEERAALLKAATGHLKNVEIRTHTGLLVDMAGALGVDAVVRGIRTAADMDSEIQMARLNRQIADVETVFLAAAPQMVHISASYVRDIGRFGGNLQGLVPDAVLPQIAETLKNQKG